MFSVCVCILGLMCLTFLLLRDVFEEFKIMFGSLVVFHAWLHSYLCFSPLKKLFLSNLDSFSTPGYLSRFSTSFYRNLDSFLTTKWIDRQTFWTLDSLSTVGGSIELFYYLFYWSTTLFLEQVKLILYLIQTLLFPILDPWQGEG